MKITVTSASSVPTSRLVQRIREEVLSSRTVGRLERQLEDEHEARRIRGQTLRSRPV